MIGSVSARISYQVEFYERISRSMFEKKIKTFFNSVKIGGEFPAVDTKLDKRIRVLIEISVGTACAVVGGVLLMCFVDKFGKELPE